MESRKRKIFFSINKPQKKIIETKSVTISDLWNSDNFKSEESSLKEFENYFYESLADNNFNLNSTNRKHFEDSGNCFLLEKNDLKFSQLDLKIKSFEKTHEDLNQNYNDWIKDCNFKSSNSSIFNQSKFWKTVLEQNKYSKGLLIPNSNFNF